VRPSALLWMSVHVVVPWTPAFRFDGVGIAATTAAVSNDKARVCGLWDARPIVVVAQRPVDWRLASCATQHGVCVCWPNSTSLAAKSAPMRPPSCLTASLAAAPAADSPVHTGVT